MLAIVLFSSLGPQTGSGAVPRTPETPPHSLPLRGRPRDALFSFQSASKVLAILIRFWKLRNFSRPINARSASMKGATAKRHLPFWITLRLVLCRDVLFCIVLPQSFVLDHGTCAGQRRLRIWPLIHVNESLIAGKKERVV